VWGLDLSQSLQGAGGVGGFLACWDYGDGDIYVYFYDGNGNVRQVIYSITFFNFDFYQYDPFGNMISNTGNYIDDKNFRWSSKYRDEETGLIYYGHRYYAPKLGLWINKDPIGEHGGINHYQYVNNDGVNFIDYLGMEVIVIAVKHPNGDWDSFVAVEGTVYGYIVKEQYYIVPSVYGKGNMVVKDYSVTVFGKGEKTMLSSIVFKDKDKLFNTEGKEYLKRTLSLILSVGGPLSKMTGSEKTAQIFGLLGDINTANSSKNYINKIFNDISNQKWNWKNWLWEASGFVPVLSIGKSSIDLISYESKSIEPFEDVADNGFEKANIKKVIDLNCGIDRIGLSYKTISEAIVRYHGF
ncbi:YD repeat-containing protein, partial [Candidatus Magnetomorum sp. HK-1]